jgi:hypothetical protein
MCSLAPNTKKRDENFEMKQKKPHKCEFKVKSTCTKEKEKIM